LSLYLSLNLYLILFLESRKELCSFIPMALKFEDTPQGGWSAQTFEIRLRPQQAQEQGQQQYQQNVQQQAQSSINDPFEVLGDVEFESEAAEAADKGILVPEMVFVKGGEFMMGSEESENARPVHRVKVDSFEIGKYPVTQREWEAVMGSNPSHFKGENRPVESVSWNDCQEYISRLNEMTGRNFRLPTEAEWEYAAGGGADFGSAQSGRTRWAGTDDEKELSEYAWYSENGDRQTWPVGQKKPNHLGLYDMSGNVEEWCEDKYNAFDEKGFQKTEDLDKAIFTVSRGGSWVVSDISVLNAFRNGNSINDRFNYIGFRLARSVNQNDDSSEDVILEE
jgi:formylglycine-generating enzyme required for sulfatase activity